MNEVIASAIIPLQEDWMRLYLREDTDGRYRWYEEGGEDTEVSGGSIADAVLCAAKTWGAWTEITLKIAIKTDGEKK